MEKAKGMHLWGVRFGYTTYWITTRQQAPQLAIKLAQKAAKDDLNRNSFRMLEYRGAIDA